MGATTKAKADLSFFVWSEFTTKDFGIIGDLRSRNLLNHFEKIELTAWVLVSTHNQNVFEALVIFSTVKCFTITHTVELEAFKSFDNFWWIEGTSIFTCIGIQKSLYVASVSSH